MDLAWVAAGKIDAYYECVEPWDMAAGALLVREAGGKVAPYWADESQPLHSVPTDLQSKYLLAANPTLWPQMRSLLRECEQPVVSHF
jgi:myo-inositol-1(or 4)-monophosphatase